MTDEERKFVSRGGLKLDGALSDFGLDVSRLTAADFGCNVGGFTDCLLQRDAGKVHAIDTGYGDLAWTLRKDDRVVVHERTNALHLEPVEPVDLVVLDMSWTPLHLGVPQAAKWLKPDCLGIVALLKPHYEYAKLHKKKLHRTLTSEEAEQVRTDVCERLDELGFEVRSTTRCRIKGKGGNREFLLWLVPR